MNKSTIKLAVLLVCFLPLSCSAVLNITVDSLTNTSITFTLKGTPSSGASVENPNRLYIQAPGISWVSGPSSPSYNILDASASPLSNADFTTDVAATDFTLSGSGDYIVMWFDGDLGDLDGNGTKAVGSGVPVTFSTTDSTTFNPAALSSLILTWGTNGGNRQPFGVVQSAVPEPSTFALIGGLLALGLVLRRRL
ncbi:MAG: PEP-CTERM sorting domain-containing protein [Verrucomicrobia bacterium]|jgi:hypothetical protein|nr:PEP-CTERM sorting domain-containing protein [Verrucomicrobiota bacterium]